MSGGSRGIGLAIAIEIGRRGGNVVMLAKTSEPDPRLPGTIHTAVDQVLEAGGQALAVVGDVRDEISVNNAAERAVDRFGGIDICINNASALVLDGTEAIAVKKFDLMQQIQIRGTFLLTRAALPHLGVAPNPHVLTLSPPLNLAPHWLGAHPPYTVAKYGMTLLALGWASEYAAVGVASNTLWPQTLIATAAVRNVLGDDAATRARDPQIMADAAIELLARPARACTGNTYLDVDVLAEIGVEDFGKYGGEAEYDIYVDGPAKVR
jgi:NAD(P)-dependent dehydrogenase (short-subunit alcohol dehydrogenase family)